MGKMRSFRDSMRVLKEVKSDYDSRGDGYGTEMSIALGPAIVSLNDIPSNENKRGFASDLATAAQHGDPKAVEEVSRAIRKYRIEIAYEI